MDLGIILGLLQSTPPCSDSATDSRMMLGIGIIVAGVFLGIAAAELFPQYLQYKERLEERRDNQLFGDRNK